MTTKVAVASFEGPKRGYNFLMEDTDEPGAATSLQKRTLTDLIFQHIDNEEKREGYLNQICDITKAEAADWILEFTMGQWR